jgi:hypothetical protein
LWKPVRPEVSSEVVNFIKEVLSFLARMWLCWVGQLLFELAIGVQIQVKAAVTVATFSLHALYE